MNLTILKPQRVAEYIKRQVHLRLVKLHRLGRGAELPPKTIMTTFFYSGTKMEKDT